MKKFFVVLAVLGGLSFTEAFAGTSSLSLELAEVQDQVKYEPLDITELPQAVKDAIETNYKDQTISAAAVSTAEDGSKTYKVTLTTSDGTETEVLFNENGEVQPS